MYYDTESVLTSDTKRLERKLICRTDEEKNALLDVLDEFFMETAEGFYHERCDAEIEKYRSNISAKAKAGIASAKARQQKAAKRKQNSTGVKSRSTNQEPRTNNQEPINKEKKTKETPSACLAVFDYWKLKMNHPKAVFDDSRKRLINKSLQNYSFEDCKKAIDGCSVTPHNMGQNQNNKKYDGINLIFRNSENIERFMGNAGSSSSPQPIYKEARIPE